MGLRARPPASGFQHHALSSLSLLLILLPLLPPRKDSKDTFKKQLENRLN